MTEAPTRPEPELVTAEGPWGGPVYRYRGAEIRCLKGGHVCALLMPEHPLHGATFGVVGTVTPLIERVSKTWGRLVPDRGGGRWA